jgi:hypothetical protein
MVSTKSTLLALAATVSTAAPTDPAPVSSGSAIVVNRCTMPVFLHFAGPQAPGTTTVAASGNYTEPLIHDKDPNVGRAIIIATSETPGAPELTFAYTLNDTLHKIYYNLSPPSQHVDIIANRTMVVTTSDTGKQNACPNIILRPGSDTNSNDPNQTKECSSRFDVLLILCRDL